MNPGVCFNAQIVNNSSSCISPRISGQSLAIHSLSLHTYNNWTAWKFQFISFSIRSNVSSQHDQQDERSTGQLPNQSGHCPLTGCYFEPWLGSGQKHFIVENEEWDEDRSEKSLFHFCGACTPMFRGHFHCCSPLSTYCNSACKLIHPLNLKRSKKLLAVLSVVRWNGTCTMYNETGHAKELLVPCLIWSCFPKCFGPGLLSVE